jgi:phospholipase/carboxylesterase
MSREVSHASTLDYLVLYPDGYQDGTVYPLLIWLHGFGADMHDLADIAAAVHRSGYLHVLPNAPLGGFDGPEGTVRAWFERGGKESQESVRLALDGLDALVKEIVARFRAQAGMALLVGFSQGGNLALRFGLPRPHLFAGLAALSCSLSDVNELRTGLPARRDLPIFLAHGSDDRMVPVECSQRMLVFLKEQGYQPIYQEYPMGHEISPTLFADLVQWITRTLPPRGNR